jgi:mRNA export factor
VATTGQATPKLWLSHPAPVLALDWTGCNVLMTGACDGIVRMTSIELGASSTVEIGAHAAPIQSLFWNHPLNVVVSGGWDKHVRVFDPRQIPVGSKRAACEVAKIKMADRVHAMDNRDNLLVVALANRSVSVYDLRNTKAPEREYPPFMDYPASSISIFPDFKSFATASVEGRIRVQYFLTDDVKKSFYFRCHKLENNAYAVNSMAVHKDGILATAGSDGTYAFWDKEKRHRCHNSQRMPQPITATAFNERGTIFAYAVGYDWAKGAANQDKSTPPTILLHGVDPIELLPKP